MTSRLTALIAATSLATLGLLTPATQAAQAAIRPATAPAPAISIAAGVRHSVALGADGLVYATGNNEYGQLGDDTTDSGDTLAPMTGLPAGVHPTGVAAGSTHSLVLGSDGIAYATGENGFGRLGDGTTADRHGLTAMAGLPDGVHATALAAGTYHSLVLGSDGIAYATGANDNGQLGDGTSTERHSLAPMTGLPPGVHATAIATGNSHSVVLGSDGIPYGAGDNTYGQIGDDTIPDRHSLTPITDLPPGVHATAIATSDLHSLVLGSDGIAYGIGSNANGQLGDGGTAGLRLLTPMTGLPAGAHATAIAAGLGYSLVLGSDGTAYGTGDNSSGQLGDGTTTERHSLTPITGLPAGVHAIAIAAGGHHTLVRGENGLAYGTGSNFAGQLTDHATDPQTTLVALSGQPLANLNRPAITGHRYASTLSINPGRWSLTPTSYTYQWLRDGHPLPTATRATYQPRLSDIGHHFTVTLTAHRDGYRDGTATSPRTVKITKGTALRYTRDHKPRLTGNHHAGHKLKIKGAKKATFAPHATRLTYRWYRNGHTIKHATKATYRTRKADRGKKLKVKITAHRPGHANGHTTTKAFKIRR